MFKELNPLLLSQLRLAVISFLVTSREAEFNVLKESTGATAGNLSIQIGKLQEASYITVEKSFRGNYPLTVCKITPEGVAAFEAFVADLKSYF